MWLRIPRLFCSFPICERAAGTSFPPCVQEWEGDLWAALPLIRGLRAGRRYQGLWELGPESRRGWYKQAVVSQAGSAVPGQAVLRGLGIAAPLLRELPPVGVMGNRLHGRPGLHMESFCTKQSVGPSQAPRVSLQQKSCPISPAGWGT